MVWQSQAADKNRNAESTVRLGNTSNSVKKHCFIDSLPTYRKSHTEWHTSVPPVLKRIPFLVSCFIIMSIIYFYITILKEGILLDIMNLSVCNSN
jgi:hypothetical protein